MAIMNTVVSVSGVKAVSGSLTNAMVKVESSSTKQVVLELPDLGFTPSIVILKNLSINIVAYSPLTDTTSNYKNENENAIATCVGETTLSAASNTYIKPVEYYRKWSLTLQMNTVTDITSIGDISGEYLAYE